MKRKNKIMLSILMIFSTIIVGVYFFASRAGILPKGKMAYNKPNIDTLPAQNAEIIPSKQLSVVDQSVSVQGVNIVNDQKLAANKQSIEDSQKTAPSNNQNIDEVKVLDKSPEKTTAKQMDTNSNIGSLSFSAGKIVSNFVSFGFQKSTSRLIKAIIIHTSYNALGGDVFNFDKVMQEWKDAGVAPHYAIDRSGVIYQLVADQNIAWHAGSSKLPDGTTDVNSASIGVEVINSQDAKFTDDQYTALNSLIASLKKKYDIKYVLGHDDIAPGRKTDPWNIDWSKVQK